MEQKAFFEWDMDRFGVGLHEVDDQHQELIKLLNMLHHSISAKQGDKVSMEVLNGLIDYTARHFAFEEKLMTDTKYPEVKHHKEIHADLVRQVVELNDRISKGKEHITFELLQFLSQWLSVHICGDDRKFGEWFSSKGYTIEMHQEAVAIIPPKKKWWHFW